MKRSHHTYVSEQSLNPDTDDIEEIKLDDDLKNQKNLMSQS